MSDDLRDAFEASRDGRTASGCPEPEELARILSSGSASERRRLAAHAGLCRHCAAETRLALATADSVAATGTLSSRFFALLDAFVPRSVGMRFAFAAAAVLLVVPWALMLRASRQNEAFRGAPATSIVVVPPDGARLAEPPEELSFRGYSAARFRVLLLDELATPIWESPFGDETTVRIPDEVRAKLRAGGAFDWRVVRLEGARKSESPLFRFEVARSAGAR